MRCFSDFSRATPRYTRLVEFFDREWFDREWFDRQ